MHRASFEDAGDLSREPTEFLRGVLDEGETKKKERVTVTLHDAWKSKIQQVVAEGFEKLSNSASKHHDEDHDDGHNTWALKLAQEAEKNAREKKANRRTPGLLRIRGRRRNSVKYDIFAEFGKDHEGLVEIEVGGIVKQRANFRRYWHSEPELKRWKEGLVDYARHDKIFESNRRAVNQEYYNQEMADLTQKHNGLFRQREPVHIPRHHRPPALRNLKELQAQIVGTKVTSEKKRQREQATAFLQSDFLRPERSEPDGRDGLQRATSSGGLGMGPRKSASAQDEGASMRPRPSTGTAISAAHDEGEVDIEHMGEQDASIHSFLEFLRRRCPTGPNGTLDDGFQVFDIKKRGAISFQELNAGLVNLGYKGDIKYVWRLLDHNSSGSFTLKDLQKLKPYLRQYEGIKVKDRKMLARKSMHNALAVMTDPKTPDGSQDSSESASLAENHGEEDGKDDAAKQQPKGGRQQRFFMEQAQRHMPQTMVIMVFKNCDRAHPGVPVFASRSPSTLKELLSIAEKACAPVVGPAEALYDLNFTLVRRLEDVINGGSYLMKGAEVTLDPPASFFTQVPVALPSLKQVAKVLACTSAEREFEPIPARSVQALPSRGSAQSQSAPSLWPDIADLPNESSKVYLDSRASTAQGGFTRPSSKGTQSFSTYEPSSRPCSSPLGSYWEVDGRLARKMGLGSTKHRNWDITPVLGTRPVTCDSDTSTSYAQGYVDF